MRSASRAFFAGTLLIVAGHAAMAAGGPIAVVRGGCAVGFYRNGYGACRPGGTFFGYPAGGFRRCVLRDTPAGPRRVCRFVY